MEAKDLRPGKQVWVRDVSDPAVFWPGVVCSESEVPQFQSNPQATLTHVGVRLYADPTLLQSPEKANIIYPVQRATVLPLKWKENFRDPHESQEATMDDMAERINNFVPVTWENYSRVKEARDHFVCMQFAEQPSPPSAPQQPPVTQSPPSPLPHAQSAPKPIGARQHRRAVNRESSDEDDEEDAKGTEEDGEDEEEEYRHDSEEAVAAAVPWSREELKKVRSYLAALDNDADVQAALRLLQDDGVNFDNEKFAAKRARKLAKKQRRAEKEKKKAAKRAREEENGGAEASSGTAGPAPTSAVNGSNQLLSRTASSNRQVALVKGMKVVDPLPIELTQKLEKDFFLPTAANGDSRNAMSVLDPIYRYVATIGAVQCNSKPLSTAFCLPDQLQNETFEDLKVLAVTVGKDHKTGWMENVDMDDGLSISMIVEVNGVPHSCPANWVLRTQESEKKYHLTVIPIDVTEAVRNPPAPLIGAAGKKYVKMMLNFTSGSWSDENNDEEEDGELQLWKGIVALIVVKPISIAEATKSLAEYSFSREVPSQSTKSFCAGSHRDSGAHSARLSRQASAVDITTATVVVSTQCPLSSMTMCLPCRGRSCEHFQCFDLVSFLQAGCQRHMWSCPICSKPLPPEDITVDEPLRIFLEHNRAQKRSVSSAELNLADGTFRIVGGSSQTAEQWKKRASADSATIVD